MGQKRIYNTPNICTAEYTMFEVKMAKARQDGGDIHKITHFVELVE